jgi:hypothetical protein
VEDVGAVEVEAIDERERRLGPVDLGDGDRPVEATTGVAATARSWS